VPLDIDRLGRTLSRRMAAGRSLWNPIKEPAIASKSDVRAAHGKARRDSEPVGKPSGLLGFADQAFGLQLIAQKGPEMRGRLGLAGAEFVSGRSNSVEFLTERAALRAGVQMGALGARTIGSLGEGLGELGALRAVCFRLLGRLGIRRERVAMRNCDVPCGSDSAGDGSEHRDAANRNRRDINGPPRSRL
jgi:hypothetical protein